MKKIVFGVFIALSIVMTGCLDDGDDDGYSLSRMWVGFGVLRETADESVRIVMDNDDVLIPVASNHDHSWNEDRHDDNGKAIEVGDRLLLNYTILSDDVDTDGNLIAYFVKLNAVDKILMKDIMDITPENEDSIGHDPIIVKDAWMTDSLLNFKIMYWGNSEAHFINLVKQPGELIAEDQPFELELRHNNNGDSEDFPFTAYVSFKLRTLEIEGLDSVQFRVSAVAYDEDDYSDDGTYVYGMN